MFTFRAAELQKVSGYRGLSSVWCKYKPMNPRDMNVVVKEPRRQARCFQKPFRNIKVNQIDGQAASRLVEAEKYLK